MQETATAAARPATAPSTLFLGLTPGQMAAEPRGPGAGEGEDGGLGHGQGSREADAPVGADAQIDVPDPLFYHSDRDALHGDLPGLQLKGLLGLRGQHQSAPDYKGGAHVLLCYLLVVFQALPLKDHLDGLEAAAVVELYESEIFHIPDCSHPAADGHLLSAQALAVCKYSRYSLTLHMALHPFSQ